MRYYLDCEFNGFGGALLSFALVPWNRRQPPELTLIDGLYIVLDPPTVLDPWVRENVMPLMDSVPWAEHVGGRLPRWSMSDAREHLQNYLKFGGPEHEIIADWPDDFRYLCDLMLTGPGTMISSPETISMTLRRVDSYPTTLEGAVRHNAWWDAMALRTLLEPVRSGYRGEHP